MADTVALAVPLALAEPEALGLSDWEGLPEPVPLGEGLPDSDGDIVPDCVPVADSDGVALAEGDARWLGLAVAEAVIVPLMVGVDESEPLSVGTRDASCEGDNERVWLYDPPGLSA